MNLSRDSVMALQRHFLGALSAPARTWLEPVPSPPLVFAGQYIRPARDGCVLDLGEAASPGEMRTVLHVFSRVQGEADVRLVDQPSWLTVRWMDESDMELTIAHDAEREFSGTLRFLAGEHVQELIVRLVARRAHPRARFRFHGSPEPTGFAFDDADGPYRLSVTNETSVPLIVTVADLPNFLRFEVDGQYRNGPLPGPFFERAAPFDAQLRPVLSGSHEGLLHIRTNDPRPAFQNIALSFTATLESPKRMHAVAPRAGGAPGLRSQTVTTLVALLLLALLFIIVRGSL